MSGYFALLSTNAKYFFLEFCLFTFSRNNPARTVATGTTGVEGRDTEDGMAVTGSMRGAPALEGVRCFI